MKHKVKIKNAKGDMEADSTDHLAEAITSIWFNIYDDLHLSRTGTDDTLILANYTPTGVSPRSIVR